MNERIKEIHRQVMLWSDTPDCPDTVEWHPGQIPEEYTKKFAELIIQKCISKIALVGISGFDNEDISWAVQTAITSIKGHFGVEE